jgi:putative Holliday junction resolvase
VSNGRVLCLDYGQKRIGVAVSDPFGMMALPQNFVPNNSGLPKALRQLIDEFNIGKIVLGLPLNLQKQETESSRKVRAFADRVLSKFGLEIVYQDERFSTTAVERELIAADLSRQKRKEVIDSQAAAFILQGYLDKLKSSL